MTNIESTTWFDLLPTEIIFLIFEYLSTNDIIYTFIDFSQRLNNLLLENQRYLTSLVLPTTNLNIWKNIFTVIGPKIKCLIIESDELTIPLTYFPNLKSIVYFSPFRSSDEQTKLFVQSDQFKHFYSLKVKKDKPLPYEFFYGFRNNQNDILNKVFNNKNALEIFQYTILPRVYEPFVTNNFMINFNLHSLILTLVQFNDIFTLIEYTPNLKYLNIHSQLPTHCNELLNEIKINLKELHLKFTGNILSFNLPSILGSNFNYSFIDIIKQFPSSLICLSLDLINLGAIDTISQYPFNIRKFQDSLESMKELKQFHLYAQINRSQFDNDFILTKLCDQYWSFGMHGKYLYTLPFYFNYLYDFPNNFNDIQSNNPDILENNSRIWFNVKSLELSLTHQYDFNFVRELKIKMPKLNLIKFKKYSSSLECKTEVLYSSNEEQNKSDIILNKVTTIEVIGGSIEQINEWLIYSLPEIKHLILSWRNVSSIDDQLAEILNERIEELDITDDSNLKNLAEISYVHFSNVQFVNLWLYDYWKESAWLVNIIIEILKNFKNLKKLLIYRVDPEIPSYFGSRLNMSKIFERLDTQGIRKNYQIKHYENYSVFSKRFS